MKIDELDLSVRSYNALKRARIDTVEELKAMSDEQLQRVRGLGAQSIEEIRQKLCTKTNADMYRAMTDEELAAVIMCPHDADSPNECGREERCYDCCLKFLLESMREVRL